MAEYAFGVDIGGTTVKIGLFETAGTLALLNGASPREVQQLLRHSNINTTMIYAHELDRAKNNCELKVADAIF